MYVYFSVIISGLMGKLNEMVKFLDTWEKSVFNQQEKWCFIFFYSCYGKLSVEARIRTVYDRMDVPFQNICCSTYTNMIKWFTDFRNRRIRDIHLVWVLNFFAEKFLVITWGYFAHVIRKIQILFVGWIHLVDPKKLLYYWDLNSKLINYNEKCLSQKHWNEVNWSNPHVV